MSVKKKNNNDLPLISNKKLHNYLLVFVRILSASVATLSLGPYWFLASLVTMLITNGTTPSFPKMVDVRLFRDKALTTLNEWMKLKHASLKNSNIFENDREHIESIEYIKKNKTESMLEANHSYNHGLPLFFLTDSFP